MRSAPLALALMSLAGLACRRGALQPDAGGGGLFPFDASVSEAGGTFGDRIGGDAAPGASDVHPPTPDANCGTSTLAAGYVAPQILVLLDQSVSGDPSKWSDVINALTGLVVQNGPLIDWALYTFPEAGIACGSGTVSPLVDIPVTPMNYATEAAGIRAAATDGQGAPTAAAIAQGTDYLRSLGGDQPKFMMLVTDHAPSCAGMIGTLNYSPTQALADANTAVTVAANQGFGTFVLAPSTTAGDDAVALNTLAQAGGYPRATSGVKFDTELTLSDQFATIDSTCTFPLSGPPPVPENVAVAFNGVPIPRDTTHMSGWDYSNGQNTNIELYGDWCVRVIDSRSYQITIFFGCP